VPGRKPCTPERKIPVYAPKSAQIPGLDFTGVVAGEEFTAAGFRVTAQGGRHARIYGDLPDCANLGYLVEDRLYHPGSSVPSSRNGPTASTTGRSTSEAWPA
jgi:hypothetical protein